MINIYIYIVVPLNSIINIMFGVFIVHLEKHKVVKQGTKHPNVILAIAIQVAKSSVHCPLLTGVICCSVSSI